MAAHDGCLVGAGNQIEALPDAIGSLRNLRMLNLAFNALITFPLPVLQIGASLTTLNIASNQLSSLPDEISQLRSLTSLIAHDNHLTALPESLAQLPLTELQVYGNKFTTLPPVIAKLKKVEVIDLHGCLIDRCDARVIYAIAEGKTLRELNLSSNKLRVIPEDFQELFLLRELNLSHNPVSTFEGKVQTMSNLKFNWQDWQK